METYTHYFNTVGVVTLQHDMKLLSEQIKNEVSKQPVDDLPVYVLHYLMQYITTSGCYGIPDPEIRIMLLEDIRQENIPVISTYKRAILQRIMEYNGKKYTRMPTIGKTTIQIFQRAYFDDLPCEKMPASLSFTVQECKAHYQTFIPIMATALHHVINELVGANSLLHQGCVEYVFQARKRA